MTESITLSVEGMKCGGCEANVTNKLKSLAGVESAVASRITKEVQVEFDSNITSRSAISQAVAEAGYKVID